MKIGFWTLGMPPWTNSQTAERAAELGYAGVDLRCTRAENGRPANQGNLCLETTDAEVEETKTAFAASGVEISSLLCENRGGLGGPETDWDAFRADVVEHAQFAQRVGTPMVRLGIGRPGSDTTWEVYLQQAFNVVQRALDEAPGISAVFQNHAGAASAAQLLGAAEIVGDPRIGATFSPDHAVVMQEDPVELIDRYAPWIHQVCYSDRKVVQEDLGKFDLRYYYVRYEACVIGEGMVPAAKIFRKLTEKGYQGYVSLKWEKSDRFGLHLPDGDIALTHFIEYVRSFGVESRSETVAGSNA